MKQAMRPASSSDGRLALCVSSVRAAPERNGLLGRARRAGSPGGVGSGVEISADQLTIEREKGFEPSTSTLARLHSTTELLPQWQGLFLAAPRHSVKRSVISGSQIRVVAGHADMTRYLVILLILLATPRAYAAPCSCELVDPGKQRKRTSKIVAASG